MKKLLIVSLLVGAGAFAAPQVEANAATSVVAAQTMTTQVRRGYRRPRTVITTRVRRVGPYRYRETIRTTYFANGRTRTVVTRRVRLAGRG